MQADTVRTAVAEVQQREQKMDSTAVALLPFLHTAAVAAAVVDMSAHHSLVERMVCDATVAADTRAVTDSVPISAASLPLQLPDGDASWLCCGYGDGEEEFM